MAATKDTLLGLDVGERRIGVAIADTIGKTAMAVTTLQVDGTEMVRLQRLMFERDVTAFIVGLPRNMSGEKTQQTTYIEDFVIRRLAGFDMPVHFQDESLTSVQAEQELKRRGKPYAKADIDSQAAAIILQDYLEADHGH